MGLHLFSAGSSPGSANVDLKRVADDGEDEFGKESVDFMHYDVDVDDRLKQEPINRSLHMHCILESTSILPQQSVSGKVSTLASKMKWQRKAGSALSRSFASFSFLFSPHA